MNLRRSHPAIGPIRYSTVKFVLSLLTLCALGVLAGPSRADDAATAPWTRKDQAALRLIAGPTAASGKQKVGVEIMMAPGAKTFWRSPGEAGEAPKFDWSGSVNVGGLDVRWPVPERFAGGTGPAIGYAGEVVIPISVQPVEADKPVWLVLTLDFTVCDDKCVPVSAESRLWLEPGVTDVRSPRLESFERRVPKPVPLGPHDNALSLLSATPETVDGRPALRLSLQPPAGGKVDDIFIEGAGAWAFGAPMLTPAPDGKVSALIRIDERPKGVPGPVPLVVTLRGAPSPVEIRLDLDIPSARP